MDDTSEDAWRKGRVAGRAGCPRDASSYPVGSELALDWADGWLKGAKLRNRRKEPPEPSPR